MMIGGAVVLAVAVVGVVILLTRPDDNDAASAVGEYLHTIWREVQDRYATFSRYASMPAEQLRRCVVYTCRITARRLAEVAQEPTAQGAQA